MLSHFLVMRTGARSLRVVGEVDAETCALLGSAIDALLLADGDIAVDMSAVSFLDSSGISSLLQRVRALHGFGTVIIRSPSRQVVRLMELAGLIPVPAGLALGFESTTLDACPGGSFAALRLTALCNASADAQHRAGVLVRRSRALVAGVQARREDAASPNRRRPAPLALSGPVRPAGGQGFEPWRDSRP